MVQNEKNKNAPEKSDGVEVLPFIDGLESVNKHVNLNKHPPTWKENLSCYFSQYCGATSIHGVQYLGERGRYIAEKIFWGITIITVWYLCIMLIVKTYNKWITSPVIVTFSTTETPISTIPFPAITICPAVKSDPEICSFTDVLLKKIHGMEVAADENAQFEALSLVCSGVDEYLFKDKNRKLTVNEDVIFYLAEASPDLHNNTSEVSWLGNKIELEKLSHSISSDGFCYSFNMLDYSELLNDPEGYMTNRSIKSTKARKWSLDGGYPDGNKPDTFPRRTFLSGLNGGFQAILHTNATHLDYLCGDMLQGFKVTLHHPCEIPDMDQHFRVPLDQAVLVAIKPRMITISDEIKSYKPEDRKCYLSNERPLCLFKSYTQQNCFAECLSNYTLFKCGCIPFYMAKFDATPICGSGSNICVGESKVHYLSNSNCNCLPSCTSLEYDVEISQSDWNWRGMFKVLSQVNPKYKEIFDDEQSHFSMVAVYYKEMQFLTSERHELYGYVDFFSNTGGLLGLFIGFSVTSAIESCRLQLQLALGSWENNEVSPINSDTNHQTFEMSQRDKSKNTPNKASGVEDIPFVDCSPSASKSVNVKKHPPTWKENLSFYFSQYCSATSIHGVQYLGERGRFITEKMFWGITIITVWCFCIMLIVKTYNKWVTSPVIVTFSTTETPISEIPFPAITICPEVKSDPEIFSFTDVWLKKFHGMEVTPYENKQYEAFSLVCSGIGELILEDKNQKLTVNDDVFGYLAEAFPGLRGNGSEVQWLGNKIALEKLSDTISSDGLCYSFNMMDYSELLNDPKQYMTNSSIENTKPQKWSLDGGYSDGDKFDTFPRRTFLSGLNGGFQAILYTNATHLDYLCGDMLQGFKVTLHHPCEIPDMDKHFRVPLDQAVLVAIKPRMIKISEEIKSYKPEDRKCYLSKERHLTLFKSYTQQNCLAECLSNYTLLQCGCIPFYMTSKEDDRICGSGNKACVGESKLNYLSNSNCNCLPSCTSLEYDVEISQSDWNWRGMFKVLSKVNPNYKEVIDDEQAHISMVTVYYKEMQFLTSERHELYGYVDFFSNTGGLLGLFIGFSVTSAIEILYFLTLRLGCNIRKFGKLFWSGEPELINVKAVPQT